MKNKLIISCTVLLLTVIAACSAHTATVAGPSIRGSWKLTETLADIGDGKGQWTPVAKDNKDYAKFNPDGTIEGTALTDATHYKIVDSVHMELVDKHNTSPITYRYKLTSTTLLLQPPCREACGIRFVRLK